MTKIAPEFIPVTQPIGTFYLAVMKVGVLLKTVDILRRDFSDEGRERVQREYSEEQGKLIGKYAIGSEATFPTSIILAAYKNCVQVDDTHKRLELGRMIPSEAGQDEDIDTWQPLTEDNLFKIGEIVDGQHRLLGMQYAIQNLGAEELNDFEMPVVFMLDLNPNDKAYVFSTINGTQRKVNSSLIADLFGLRDGRSPAKTCHEIAEIFYKWPGGPFQNGLKMLGKKTQSGEMLSQGSFSKYILRLITRNLDKDEQRLKDDLELLPDPSCPMRTFYIEKKDDSIARILHEYFRAIQNEFELEWDKEPEKYLLRKTVGFAALTKAFIIIWDKKKVSTPKEAETYFGSVAKEFRVNLGNKELTSKDFASSEKGAQDLADKLTGTVRPPKVPK